MNSDKKSKLEKLERGLYSRHYNEPDSDSRSEINRPEVSVDRDWGEQSDEELINLANQSKNKKPSNFTKKIFIGSFIFFLISFAVTALIFLTGGNSVSSKNIEISVLGPVSVSAGEELSLDITIKNKNNTDLESASITVEYPEGSREISDVNRELLRQREDLDRVPSGKEVRKTVKSILFGEKEDIKVIKITLEYRIKGSSAVFYKDKIYEIAIKSAPVIVTTEVAPEVNSGQDLEMTVEIASNSPDLLQNILVTAEFPFGFNFESSNPNPVLDNNVWRIGDLPSGEKRVIKIKGKVQGQNEEERTVRFFVGIASDKNEGEIGALMVSLAKSFTIKKPFIDLAISINNDTNQDYIASAGERIQVNLVWTNNLSGSLLNTSIKAHLSGEALDQNNVTVSGSGFFRSTNNTITWDSNSSSDLSEVGPGERGVVSFILVPRENSPTNAGNQTININVTAEGNQVLPVGPPQKVVSNALKTIKLRTNLSLTARALHSVGPFENSGPIPPVAEQETTYTIIWNVTNTHNNVNGVRVRSTLPAYVSWNNLINPGNEKISYNPSDRSIVWNVGDVSSGTGFVSSPKEVAFQVTLEPSLSQVGTEPNLTSQIDISGLDLFTNKSVSSFKPPLSTKLSNDPFFQLGQGVVVK